MAYKIKFTPAADRQFAKLIPERKRAISDALMRLAENPRHHGVIKLSGEHDLYRVRVGNYRVIFQIEDDVLYVVVVKIGHRKEIYKS
ncbi:type II toxin-antitoxin system RelE family toxin [Methylomicrobium lacus]|uniref:type II toxin-antitoxin system RelE family toxin n=1 Tax=Methylomicrobium lacus TaxID=136992 RepID=UPI00045E6BA2|nr:type II toxin-antitoxin system RelE/ParE family toxin [Methylomicrobium lacus]